MAKSTAIQGKGHAFFLNGDIVKRLQSGDWGADLAVEKVMEMANAGYVEKIPDSPKISVSLDTNDVGNMAMLYLLKNGQRLPDTGLDTLELSRDAKGCYTVTTSGEVTVTMDGTTNDLDEIRVTASGQMCPSMLIKVSEHNNSTIDRTCHLQGVYLDTVEFSYDVGGMAKENYRLSGDHKDWYFSGTNNPSTDIDMVFAEYTSATEATTTHAKPANTTVEAVYVNKELVYHKRTAIGSAPTWTGSSLTFGADTFTDDARIEVIYSYDTPRSFPALTTSNTGTSAYGTRGGLRRGNVVIYMEKQTGSTITDAQAKQLRLQSVSGLLDMGRQERYELGTQRYVDKQPTYPLNVRFDMTFNASDLQAFAHASAKEDEWLDGRSYSKPGTLDYMNVKDIVQNTKVTIELYKDAYIHTPANLVKTIVMNNCTVMSEGDTARVGQEAGQWRCTMETDNITWTGKIWQ